MTNWPDYAKIVSSGYAEAPDYGVLRDEMDSGIAVQRSRFTQPIVTRDVTFFVMSLDDKTAFDAWIANDLKGGVLWFMFPSVSGNVRARIVAGKYKWSEPAGVLWQATAQIESVGY